MTTVYATLLSVRKIEERQAEIDFAEAQRDVVQSEQALDSVRAARAAWLDDHLDGSGTGGTTNLAEMLTRMEVVEREAERQRDHASRRMDERRAALIEAQRRRQAVEDLHTAVLEAEARTRMRRAQAELDDLAGISAHARKETNDTDLI